MIVWTPDADRLVNLIPAKYDYGLIELQPFAGDAFDGKKVRRWAVVRFVAADRKTWLRLKEFRSLEEAKAWFALYQH